MNLISNFLNVAESRGAQAAIVAANGNSITYAELAAKSAQFAASWRCAGIEPGDRVLVAIPVCVELFAAIAGLWRIGATIVFPEPALGLSGLIRAAALTKPRAFLSAGPYRILRYLAPGLWRIALHLEAGQPDSGHKPAIDTPLVDLTAEHPALISFTSGSTGNPKAFMRSIGFLQAQNACLADLITPEREIERDLVSFPMFVVAGLGLGTTSVLPQWKLTGNPQTDGEGISRGLAKSDVTRVLAPPSICNLIAQSKSAPRIDALFTGGGPVFPDLMERLLDKLPTAKITAVYGSGEAEPIACQRITDITAAQWRRMRDGGGLLAGRPVPQIDLELWKDEIIVAGGHVNETYLDERGDHENKILRDGKIWHRTGDAGAVDRDGFLWLRGRLAAQAAQKYPFEIEAPVRYWPGVENAAMLPGSRPPAIVIQGVEPTPNTWRKKADSSGIGRITTAQKLPLDRRHGSKIDYTKLQKFKQRS